MGGEYGDSLLGNEVCKGKAEWMGLGKVGVQEKEFQNVIEQTHITRIEKMPR